MICVYMSVHVIVDRGWNKRVAQARVDDVRVSTSAAARHLAIICLCDHHVLCVYAMLCVSVWLDSVDYYGSVM